MKKTFPEKTHFLCPNLLFVFKSGQEKPFPTSYFIKLTAKKSYNGGNNVKIVFSHNHYPSGMKIMAKFI